MVLYRSGLGGLRRTESVTMPPACQGCRYGVRMVAPLSRRCHYPQATPILPATSAARRFGAMTGLTRIRQPP